MSTKPKLDTAEDVTQFLSRVAWDGDWKDETAAYIAEAVRLRQVYDDYLATPHGTSTDCLLRMNAAMKGENDE